MSNQFKLDKNDGVAVLAFDRPEKRNPLNEASLAELYDHLMALRDDHEVRALVLTGSGNSFCAGADLSHMKGVTDEAERVRLFSSVPARRRQLVRRTMELLVNHELPTIAAINGYAVGGGWFLALSCDFRFAVEEAEFWMPEIDLGVPGPREPERRLREEVGVARAKEIILTCRHFKSAELYEWGLLNRVVKKAELMPAAMELARYLASRKRAAMIQAKAQLNGFTLD
jgi:enoyl-CoA hydratase/carnithine racemase